MRSLLLIICALAMPCVSSAQSKQSSWANLNTLQTGEKIEVVETNLKKDTGTFAAVSDDGIRLNESTGEQTIPRANVMRVTLRRNKHRGRNTLIGMAVGAGAGAVLAAATYKTCSSSRSFCIDPLGKGGAAGIGAALGLAGGAAVGVVLPSHPTIYRAAPTQSHHS
ncbi:MAG TPA: hypothetical protein VGU63_02615 [Candidatus Acidoferrales bacterium]|nr:hypothetical protein [Candidatus Acidoferrales bacterium]